MSCVNRQTAGADRFASARLLAEFELGRDHFQGRAEVVVADDGDAQEHVQRRDGVHNHVEVLADVRLGLIPTKTTTTSRI